MEGFAGKAGECSALSAVVKSDNNNIFALDLRALSVDRELRLVADYHNSRLVADFRKEVIK